MSFVREKKYSLNRKITEFVLNLFLFPSPKYNFFLSNKVVSEPGEIKEMIQPWQRRKRRRKGHAKWDCQMVIKEKKKRKNHE